MKKFIRSTVCSLVAVFLNLTTTNGAVLRVDSAANDGEDLIQAIAAAVDDDVILIRVEEPIVLNSLNAPILIEGKRITIEGEYGPLLHSISGGGSTSIFEIADTAAVTIKRLTLNNGNSSGHGGAIFNTGYGEESPCRQHRWCKRRRGRGQRRDGADPLDRIWGRCCLW